MKNKTIKNLIVVGAIVSCFTFIKITSASAYSCFGYSCAGSSSETNNGYSNLYNNTTDNTLTTIIKETRYRRE